MVTKTKVILTRGIPASGKTTWAKEQVKNGNGKWKRVNKDDLRSMIDCGQFSKDNEKIIEEIRDSIIKDCLNHNINIIIDDTNLSERHISKIKGDILWFNNGLYEEDERIFSNINEAEVENKWFPITLEEAHYRNKNREAKVPEKVLLDMYRQYVKAGGPDPAPKIPYKVGLPNAIIVDMDGTVASFSNGHRGPYEQEKCLNDTCVEEVAQMITAMNRMGYNILIVSGRYDTYKPQTQLWLDNNMIDYSEIFMRKEGDNRSDDIIKEEIYNRHIKNKYNVLFAVDDRPCIVRLWRKLNIFVLNVGSGVEF